MYDFVVSLDVFCCFDNQLSHCLHSFASQAKVKCTVKDTRAELQDYFDMPCRKFEKEYKIEKNAISGPKSNRGYPVIKVEYKVSSLAFAYRALPFVDILFASFSKLQILSHAPSHLNVPLHK